MKKNKLLVQILLAFSLWLPLQASQTYGFEFLRTDFSPRMAGMGGAFLTMRGDLNGLSRNPAGLAALTNQQFVFNYANYLLDINGGQASFSTEVPYLKRIAVSVVYMDYGNFEETDQYAVSTGQTFSASDFALALTQAGHLDASFSYGITSKLVYSSIQNYNATALLFDFGLLYKAGFEKDLYFAVTLTNLGWNLDTYAGTKSPLPTSLNVGFSKKLAHLPLEVSAQLYDLNRSSANWYDRFKRFSAGGEFRLSEHLHLRFGYNHEQHQSLQTESASQGNFGGISAGVGLFWKNFRFDYAFTNFEYLGTVHRIGISGKLH